MIIRNNSQVDDLVKATKNKKSCARGIIVQNDYADMCQASLGQNNQCVAMSFAALIMAFIKSLVNWVKFDINNVLNQ
uniref:Cysteine protease n=1 Tax=Strongyloides venezuelensis TaxID=75913 RepID=A0A0K0FS30_STRVS